MAPTTQRDGSPVSSINWVSFRTPKIRAYTTASLVFGLCVRCDAAPESANTWLVFKTAVSHPSYTQEEKSRQMTVIDTVRPVWRRHAPAWLRRLAGVAASYTPSGLARRRWVKTYTRENLARRERLFLNVAAFAHGNRPLNGYYFEFGCNQAHTFRMAWTHFHRLFDWQFVAFDSFEGLPDIAPIDQQDIWAKGRYAITEKDFRDICLRHGVAPNRFITIKGFYDDSLNETTRQRLADKKAAVIYVDCDLYMSTVPILKFCRDFLQVGTVIIFDDWNCFCADPERGERRAWQEFLTANPTMHFEVLHGNGMQMAFACTKTGAARN